MRGLLVVLAVGLGATTYWMIAMRPSASSRAERRESTEVERDSSSDSRRPTNSSAVGGPNAGETTDLLAVLAARIPSTPPSLLRDAPEIERLARQLQDSEAAIELVLQRVQDPACPAALARVLMNLLGQSGRKTALAGLTEIMLRRDAPTGRRDMALAALVSARVMPEGLDATLIRMHTERDPLGNAALSGLVRLHSRLDSVARKRVRKTIEHSLQDGAEPDRLIPLLQAVRSLQWTEVPAAVPNALDNSDPRVRVVAAGALRWIDSEGIDEKLEGAARNDSDFNVRHAALLTLAARRRSGLQELLTDLAANDTSAVVRSAAAHLIETRTPGEPR